MKERENISMIFILSWTLVGKATNIRAASSDTVFPRNIHLVLSSLLGTHHVILVMFLFLALNDNNPSLHTVRTALVSVFYRAPRSFFVQLGNSGQ